MRRTSVVNDPIVAPILASLRRGLYRFLTEFPKIRHSSHAAVFQCVSFRGYDRCKHRTFVVATRHQKCLCTVIALRAALVLMATLQHRSRGQCTKLFSQNPLLSATVCSTSAYWIKKAPLSFVVPGTWNLV